VAKLSLNKILLS